MNLIQSSIFWLIAANVLGFGVSAFFSDKLKLNRRIYLLPYVILTSIFLFIYFYYNSLFNTEFWFQNLQWGY